MKMRYIILCIGILTNFKAHSEDLGIGRGIAYLRALEKFNPVLRVQDEYCHSNEVGSDTCHSVEIFDGKTEKQLTKINSNVAHAKSALIAELDKAKFELNDKCYIAYSTILNSLEEYVKKIKEKKFIKYRPLSRSFDSKAERENTLNARSYYISKRMQFIKQIVSDVINLLDSVANLCSLIGTEKNSIKSKNLLPRIANLKRDATILLEQINNSDEWKQHWRESLKQVGFTFKENRNQIGLKDKKRNCRK